MEILDTMNLKLSSTEFQKLWDRLDLKNTGCIKTHVFLRLVNWRPNQIDEFGQQMDILRTKSCIQDQNTNLNRILTNKRFSRRNRKVDCRQQAGEVKDSNKNNLKSESISYFDRPANLMIDETKEYKEGTKITITIKYSSFFY